MATNSKYKKLIKEAGQGLKQQRNRLTSDVQTRITQELEALKQALEKKDPKRISKAGDKLTESYDQFLAGYKKSTVREYAEAIIIAVVLALFIRTFVVQAFKIPSGSMESTLLIGDHILVSKFKYGVKIPFTDSRLFASPHPNRGDVIVFIYPVDPSKDFIKRVIAVEGDLVRVSGRDVYVNGERTTEPYAVYDDNAREPRENFGPARVPRDSVFVLGDNRDKSYDSRFWGFVKENKIKGKAFIVYWSWDSNNFGLRWRRIGHLLH